MNILEAFSKSSKLRRKSWKRDDYIIINQNHLEKWDNSNFSWDKNTKLLLKDLMATDWEIVGD